MPLLNIEDPIKQSSNNGEIAVGIDFGTTNSLCYYFDGNTVHSIVDLMPSIVYFNKEGDVTTKENAEIEIKSIKRKLATQKEIQVGEKKLWAEQIAAEILKSIKNEVSEQLGSDVKKCVITVPAYFTEPQKQAVKFAGELAGFEVIRMLSEPTAAALYYGIDNKSEGVYVVFDLGGGTFDVSVLNMEKGVLHVVAIGGEATLGGDDFDIAIANNYGISIQTAKEIKEALSYAEQISSIGIKGIKPEDIKNLPLIITQEDIVSIVIPLVEQCVKVVKNTITDSQISKSQMRGIVLVGGATRMPIIKERLDAEFGIEIFDNADADRIVALGAAVQAYNIVNRSSGNILLDVIPLSLGIETMGGAVQKIIERNSSVPIEQTVNFTTYEDMQTGIVLNVVQGERDLAKDCRQLAHFELKNITPAKAGMVKICVKFSVDENSILSVSAWEDGKENQSQIQLKPSYGINGDAIRTMLIDAIQNAQEDIEAKLLADIKNEAHSILKMINHSLTDKHLASPEELKIIKHAVETL